MKTLTKNLLLIVVIFTVSCTITPKPPIKTQALNVSDDLEWHQVRVRWQWNPQEEPNWYLEPFVAAYVFKNIIYQEQPPLWRFHRRAVPDGAGHQFSFIFFSNDESAKNIERQVLNHPVIEALNQEQLIKSVTLRPRKNGDRLDATSDPSWPKELQNAWPYFIKGVSESWLLLVEQTAGKLNPEDLDLNAELDRFIGVQKEVDELWSEWAQHAFFHHISGVFGYTPLEFRKLIRF